MIDRYVREGMGKMARQREEITAAMVGLEFRQSIRVKIQKPRWMPQWAYRKLMRTIVIEETWPVVGTR
jgi:hypothetical protein